MNHSLSDSFDITPVPRPNQTHVSAQYADESASKVSGWGK